MTDRRRIKLKTDSSLRDYTSNERGPSERSKSKILILYLVTEGCCTPTIETFLREGDVDTKKTDINMEDPIFFLVNEMDVIK